VVRVGTLVLVVMLLVWLEILTLVMLELVVVVVAAVMLIHHLGAVAVAVLACLVKAHQEQAEQQHI
jgi:hypothetical protein